MEHAFVLLAETIEAVALERVAEGCESAAPLVLNTVNWAVES